MVRGLKPPTPVIMRRIDAILQADGAIATAVLPVPPKHDVHRRRLGRVDAAAVLSALSAFRQLDNSAGGSHAHQFAVGYLDKTVTPMLRHGSYSEADGRALFAAEVLAARSHCEIHRVRPGRAVDLALAARHAAIGAGCPLVTAEAHQLEANGLALLGDRQAAAAALTACETEFDRASDSPAPYWIAYFTPAYLAARVAHVLRDAGDWSGARAKALEATALSPGMARTRAFNYLIYATAWVAEDRDAAIGAGRDVLAMTAGIQSARVAAYIKDLRTRLRRRYGIGDPEVTAFDEECRALLGR